MEHPVQAYGPASCLICNWRMRPVHFHDSDADHFWCRNCRVLYTVEMEYLLRCTNAKHISDVKRSIAA